MQRKALLIGIACAIGSLYAVGASAQQNDFESAEDEFEITLDDVIDDVSDADGIVISLIDEARDRRTNDVRESREGGGDAAPEYAADDLEDYDQDGPDDYDDGDFDDYDDGEEIGTGGSGGSG